MKNLSKLAWPCFCGRTVLAIRPPPGSIFGTPEPTKLDFASSFFSYPDLSLALMKQHL